MSESRSQLTDWANDTSQVDPQKKGWFKGEYFQELPGKAELRAADFVPVLGGWKPKQPIIGPDTVVTALGSCFARFFVLWLGDHGFNRSFPKSPYHALVRSNFAFENIAVITQQFRWAFGKFDAQHAFWIARDRQRVLPTEEQRVLTRETLQRTEVLIVTLGLSEIWYDSKSGEPLWRAVPLKSYDPSQHAFKVLSVAETRAALEEIEAIRREHLPGLKIVYSVSPVRLRATFRPISTITANCASKAILRAALDEFLRAHWDQVNRDYFYFPSYEIAMELLGDPFMADMRHLYPSVSDRLLALFAAHYTSIATDGFVPDPIGASLEEKVEELQRVCDERMIVIEGLEKAARERLELIERLDAELRRNAGS